MLKPLDFHTDFRRSFKGYNEEDVDEFVAKVVSHYEDLYQENKRLQEEIKALKQELEKKQDREQDVLDLIALTKQTAAEIRDLANARSSAVLDEAKRKAATIIAEAEARLEAVKRTERMFRHRMQALMESTWKMLEQAELDEVGEETKVYRDAAAALGQEMSEQD